MKFETLESLIRHVFDTNAPIQNINFEISIDDPSVGGDQCTDSDSCAVPDTQQPANVKVAFNSFSDKPVLEFEMSDKSVLLVDEFDVIPNSCTTTKVKLADREILIGVCEDSDGSAIAKFDITIDGKLYTNKKFTLSTDRINQKNTISLND